MTAETKWAYNRAADMLESRARILESQLVFLTGDLGRFASVAGTESQSARAAGLREAAGWLRACVSNGFVPGEDDDR